MAGSSWHVYRHMADMQLELVDRSSTVLVKSDNLDVFVFTAAREQDNIGMTVWICLLKNSCSAVLQCKNDDDSLTVWACSLKTPSPCRCQKGKSLWIPLQGRPLSIPHQMRDRQRMGRHLRLCWNEVSMRFLEISSPVDDRQ